MLSHDGRSDRRRVVSIRQEPAALPPPAETPDDLLTTALADDDWLNRPSVDRLDPDLLPPARVEDAETDGAMLSFPAESEVASSVASTARVPPPAPVARDTRAGPIVVFPAGPSRGRAAARTEARTQTPAEVRRSPTHGSPSGDSTLSPYERRTGASARWSPPTREVAADTMRRRDLEAEAAVREQAQAARQLQTGRRGVASTAVVAALVLIVAAEAVVVAWLSRPYWLGSKAPLAVESGAAGDNVLVTSRASEPAALRLAVAEDMAWVRVTSPAGEVLGRKAADASVGTVRIVSSIPIKVFEGPQLLGGAPGADLRLAPGRHELELVNAALGFRLAQTIDIEGGQAIALHVAEPFGWVTLESSPASEVSIDGQAVGPTPLGPLALSLGEHTIIFKHASGVTDRQRVIVTSRSTTKVVAKLR
jgi:hypothetical protein